MKKLMTSTASEQDKVNSLFALDIISMAKTHLMYATFQMFRNGIESMDIKCPMVKANLRLLCQVYALYELLQDSTANYETGYF